MRLAESSLYRVKHKEQFTVKVPDYISSDIHLGLYSTYGIFVERIDLSNDNGLIRCEISNKINDGNYVIQAYILAGEEKKIISRSPGSHNIDRLPITLESDWWSTRSVETRSTTEDLNGNLLLKTAIKNLHEISPNQTFNVQVYSENATTIKIGLYDTSTGTMVADVTRWVRDNDYTCKVPSTVASGDYTLIPYELVSGKPVFVERSVDMPYIVDRLPLRVVSNIAKSLSVLEFETDANISVYPNPATEIINVSGEDIQQVSIYDMSGRQVSTAKNINTISVSNLSKGTYLVRVLTANGESTHKVIKK